MSESLPMTGGGWEPVKREPKYLLGANGEPRIVYLVNQENTLKRKQRAIMDGKDPKTVSPVIAEIGTTQALYEARKSTWELFQNGESLGTQSIFRDATKEEIAVYLKEKEAAIAARNEEVARSEARNAPKVIVQNMAPQVTVKGK